VMQPSTVLDIHAGNHVVSYAPFPFFSGHPRSTITLILMLSSIYLLPSFIGHLSTTIATSQCLSPPR
jgi:hypothetical protein